MAELLTTKKLAKQVNDQILNVLDYYQGDYNTDRDANTMTLNSLLNQTTNSNQIIESVIKTLELIVPNHISWGLDVKATQPEPNNYITITKGQGVANAYVFRIDADISVPVPLETNNEIIYVVLYNGTIQFLTEPAPEALTLAKIVNPSRFATRIVDKVTVSEYNDATDAYIQSFKPVSLYQDWLGNFEEDTITLLRNNISEVLADNIVGNIRLSENLKIINTQNTLELDSKSLKLFDNNVRVAEFNRKGSYFYNNVGSELARFTTTDARIGNMLLTGNSLQSVDYISNIRGFQILDTGSAEFEDVKVRGRISSSVFEYDKISAVGGQLNISNASVLSEDIDDTQTTIYLDDNVFSGGEIVRIKVGAKDEWIKIISLQSNDGYLVQRGISGYSESWTKGTAIFSTGAVGGGYINLNAADNYSPYIDIVQRWGDDSYTQLALKTRLGNLNGINDAMYGQLEGFGLYSENVYLKGKLYAPDIKTDISGARIELDQNGLRGYTDDDIEVLNFYLNYLSGDHVAGDFVLGDVDTGNYLKWDNQLCKLVVRGDITAEGNSTISASCITAGVLPLDSGVCLVTNDSVTGRTSFDGYGITSYNSDNELTFCVNNGCVFASSIKLEDPTCACNYSYLDSGALKFHDENGSVPYVKRIANGCATSGDWVELMYWKEQPKVSVSLSGLMSYNSCYSASCQRIEVTNTVPECFCCIYCYCSPAITYGGGCCSYTLPNCDLVGVCLLDDDILIFGYDNYIPFTTCVGGKLKIDFPVCCLTGENTLDSYFAICNVTKNTLCCFYYNFSDPYKINYDLGNFTLYSEDEVDVGDSLRFYISCLNSIGGTLNCIPSNTICVTEYGTESQCVTGCYKSDSCYLTNICGEQIINYFISPHSGQNATLCFCLCGVCAGDTYALTRNYVCNYGAFYEYYWYICLTQDETDKLIQIDLGCTYYGEYIDIRALCVCASTISDYCLNIGLMDNSGCCYSTVLCSGYKFQPNIKLALQGGVFAENCVNATFGQVITTCSGVTSTRLKNQFQLWCNNAAPSNYYYGNLNYTVAIKAYDSSTWCDYVTCCYTQSHYSTSDIMSTCNAYLCVVFPTSCTWDICIKTNSLTYTDSGICATAGTSGICCIAGNNCSFSYCYALNKSTGNNSSTLSYNFTPPTGTYCTRFRTCFNNNHCIFAGGSDCSAVACSIFTSPFNSYNVCDGTTTLSSNCTLATAYCTYDYAGALDTFNFTNCVCLLGYGSIGNVWGGVSSVCLTNIAVCYWWCIYSGDARSCTLLNTYSHQDSTSSSTVLDSNGQVSWLAIAYS